MYLQYTLYRHCVIYAATTTVTSVDTATFTIFCVIYTSTTTVTSVDTATLTILCSKYARFHFSTSSLYIDINLS